VTDQSQSSGRSFWASGQLRDRHPARRSALATCTVALTCLRLVDPGECPAQGAPAGAEAGASITSMIRAQDPKGQYEVGTTRFVWTDSSRADPTLPTPGGLRQLLVQVWYPTDPEQRRGARSEAPYMLEFDQLKDALRKDPDLALDLDTFARVSTGAWLNAALSRRTPRYRLVLFSTGLGTPRALYTTFLMRLASAGYVVAAIDHPGMGLVALPDGRVAEPTDPLGQQMPPDIRAKPEDQRYDYWLTEILYLEADQRFVLDKLTQLASARGDKFGGRLDVSHVAMIGHSRGFVSGTCAAERRISACVNIEGDPDFPQRGAGIPEPFMTVRNPRDTFPSMTSILRVARVPSYDVLVQGANHNSVTDLGAFGWRDQTSAVARAAAVARLNVIADYVLAFLDETLGGHPSTLLHPSAQSSSRDVILTRYGSPH
jgi:hypothetical protein